ncbi:MAG: hypothetical protein FWF36_09415, partial [Propionibacteriaceae bacterium]|nr:hypothetical protein [Propionibacteriaceae bacterium]
DGFWAALAVDQTSQRVQGVLNIGMTTENSGSTRSWATRGLQRPGSTFLTWRLYPRRAGEISADGTRRRTKRPIAESAGRRRLANPSRRRMFTVLK